MMSWASPARRVPYKLTLANGQVVDVVKCGDERAYWIETTDGKLVIESPSGNRIATDAEAKVRREEIRQQMETSRYNRRHTIDLSAVGAGSKPKTSVGSFTPTYPTKGQVKSLIILANFDDVKFKSETAREDFQRMMMEEGYAENGGTGSAHDFYYDASMGEFDPQFEVVGPVNLSHGYAYYGENVGGMTDVRGTDMIIEACQLADAEVDFSQYDYNNDGYIDNVFVFYAGYGEATVSDSRTVWPHSYDIIEYTSEPIMLDGLRLNHYACSNELRPDGKMDGIGTFVHEYGHVLGLPDLYATNGSYSFTLGMWSVMDEGEYANDSRTPPTFSAYERFALGWLTPVELKGAATLHMPQVSENVAYRITTNNPNEYFILENRQQEGWDKYLPGHGMLVWHIDYDEYLWQMNRVNNSSYHQHVDLIEADNIQSTGTRSGDSFPGTAGVTSFTPETTPAFVDWSGNAVLTDNVASGAEPFVLTNIKEEDGIVSLDICGGGEEITPFSQLKPHIQEVTGVTATSFTANWTEVDDAETYELKVGTMLLGERRIETLDFNGGVKALPEWWETTATSTYNNDSYAGASKPSLRLQNSEDYIMCSHDGIYSLAFWFRGVSADEATKLKVEMLTDDKVWVERAIINIKDVSLAEPAEGVTFEKSGTGTKAVIAEDGMVYKAMRLVFIKDLSGSLALDDVELNYANLELMPMFTLSDITTTTKTVEGLEANTLYAYSVTALKNGERSKESNIAYVTTTDASAINNASLETPSATTYYNISGQRVTASYRGLVVTSKGMKFVR